MFAEVVDTVRILELPSLNHCFLFGFSLSLCKRALWQICVIRVKYHQQIAQYYVH